MSHLSALIIWLGFMDHCVEKNSENQSEPMTIISS